MSLITSGSIVTVCVVALRIGNYRFWQKEGDDHSIVGKLKERLDFIFATHFGNVVVNVVSLKLGCRILRQASQFRAKS